MYETLPITVKKAEVDFKRKNARTDFKEIIT